ncbi:MAG: glucose-1-phosphate adenylyltransferase subunit GlgD [Clostridia bacterium]|nr:glucose-1-phosphate adenylyltransferase subunit GlgD [Clostridia bacterium]
MRANNVLGLIFSNTYDHYLNELTAMRSMGSVPYGGRYRLIDFQLSAMVNSGIGKVGIITKSNYQSLMDHVGNGRAWDLSRKNGGLFILPPFNTSTASGIYSGRIEAISNAMDFVSHSDEEYILMTDCNTLYNFDFAEMFRQHEKTGADITIAYINGVAPKIVELAELETDDGNRITGISRSRSGVESNYAINVYLMRKALLERLINEAMSLGYHSFTMDILLKNIDKLKMYGFKAPGYVRMLDDMQSYFEANMSLLDSDNRKALCLSQPVYTKVKDDVPAIYGLNSEVKNSLIADGCVIEGQVINSVLFRGVHIGKGTVIKDSVLMQNTYVGDNVSLNCVLADKDVVIKPGKVLSGDKTFPIHIGKGIVI